MKSADALWKWKLTWHRIVKEFHYFFDFGGSLKALVTDIFWPACALKYSFSNLILPYNPYHVPYAFVQTNVCTSSQDLQCKISALRGKEAAFYRLHCLPFSTNIIYGSFFETWKEQRFCNILLSERNKESRNCSLTHFSFF